jgi:phosphoribosylpyrophosphate synthetase
VDDLLDTGKTLATTVELLKGEGADKVYGFATHARSVFLVVLRVWGNELEGWDRETCRRSHTRSLTHSVNQSNPSITQSINVCHSTNQSINQSNGQSISQSIKRSID